MKELKELRKQIKDANGGDTHIFKDIDLEENTTDYDPEMDLDQAITLLKVPDRVKLEPCLTLI